MAFFKVLRIVCEKEQSFELGIDEIRTRINGDDFWGPTKMKVDETRSINKGFNFNHRAVIRLYEEDARYDDFLGEKVITRALIGTGERELRFEETGADYRLWIDL